MGSAPVRDAVTADDQQTRVLDAALTLVARWGVKKTSLADIAKAAGCSRATVYRVFPGGKHHLFASLARRELQHGADAVFEAIDSADDLTDALTRGLVVGARLFRDHDAAQFVFEHEPDLVLPYLGFGRVDAMYAVASTVVGPHLRAHLPEQRVGWAVEWCARTFVTYLATPDPDLDLTDISHTRSLVERFVVPGLLAPAASEEPTEPTFQPVLQPA